MGLVAGFTGGVTLTLSLTYLALLTHKRNREAQSSILRSSTFAVDNLVPSHRHRNATTVLPDGSYSPRPSLEQYSDHRKGDSSFLETAKSRWNAEVASAVHWAQTKDWAAVREDAEENVSRLLGISLSREPSDTAIVRQDPARPAPVPPVEAAQRTPAAPVYSASPAVTPSPKAADTLHDAGARVAEAAQAVKEEAKGAVSRGIEKAQDLVGKAKAAVYLAEEKAEAKIDAKLLHVSDVERALQERYDSARREERMKRSVQEVLAERYTPIGERDNSRLRGL